MKTINKKIQLLNEALSEGGIFIDNREFQPIIDNLCDIIGVLHRLLNSGPYGFTDDEINKWLSE